MGLEWGFRVSGFQWGFAFRVRCFAVRGVRVEVSDFELEIWGFALGVRCFRGFAFAVRVFEVRGFAVVDFRFGVSRCEVSGSGFVLVFRVQGFAVWGFGFLLYIEGCKFGVSSFELEVRGIGVFGVSS